MTDPEASAVPVDTAVAPEIQKAVADLTGELFEKINSLESKLVRGAPAQLDENTGRAKGWFVDPFAMLDSLGMGYRSNPSPTTYETLRQMVERDTLLSAIVGTRINQMSSFCFEQENKYSIGYVIRPRDDKSRRLRPDEVPRVQRIKDFITHMGREPNVTRDNFVTFVKKLARDRLTYDQRNFEKVYTRGGDLCEILAHDASTIRIANSPNLSRDRGGPIPLAEQKKRVLYVQTLNGEPVAEYTPREMAFVIANPRTSVRVGGYGFPEPQMLIQTVTAHLWAEDWNRKAFSQGSTIKGVLNLKGAISREKYDTFKRQWMAQVGGVGNAWRTPILNSDGVEFLPMQLSNTEMGYQMWIEYLVKVGCAIYQMDPTEINFDLRASAGQQPVFMSNNEAQQKVSKDRGLKPLLRDFAGMVNTHIVWLLDPAYEFAFLGLDAETEAQAIELRQKQGQTHVTINELRALDDLDPVEHGDVIANPTFVSYLQQQAMAQQQQQAMGAGAGAGGGGGGQPQDPQQQQQAQPYQGRLGEAGAPPSAGAKRGQGALNAFADEGKPQEDDNMRYLRQNDWAASVHSSLKDNDLKKSDTPDYFDIEV